MNALIVVTDMHGADHEVGLFLEKDGVWWHCNTCKVEVNRGKKSPVPFTVENAQTWHNEATVKVTAKAWVLGEWVEVEPGA
ncbi:hypothetical protein [Longispora urticae]